MYKLLLVDDESTMRKRIIQAIDWEAYGFKIVSDAENGLDALDKIESYNPDVVITDIKMPYMDGMQLSKCIAKGYPLTKIIILTGYEDFKYAKEAIDLQVVDYILKPITKQNLLKIIDKTKKLLDEEAEKMQDLTRLREFYDNTLPVMQNRIFHQIVTDKIPKSQIIDMVKYYNIDVKANGYRVCLIKISETSDDYTKLEKNISIVENAINDKIVDDYQALCFVISSYIVVLFKNTYGKEICYIDNALTKLSSSVGKFANIKLAIAVSDEFDDFNYVSKAYRNARNALDFASSNEKSIICYYDDLDKRYLEDFDEKLFNKSKIIKALKIGDYTKIEKEVNKFFAKLDNIRVDRAKLSMLELVILIRKSAEIMGLEKNEENYEQDFLDFIKTNNDYNKAKDKILSKVKKLINDVIEETNNSANRIVKSAKEYVEKNYSDSTVKIEMVSNMVYVTPNYFSMLFKKQTGTTFNNYLTDFRLEKAKNLLKTTDMKSFEIAEKVGFSDANYFSYCFKKREGISPLSFRKS